ncbi:DEAD/DEAH box helicase [Babesia microti strain RI]|uniref:RNA helicase n=1 Tax=Babesia microti (strain RI) TaxID=1133968 RepID=I7IHP1_BABMR|nr:DEAD/DEAH box helicase [Babesia microti strain RI]CCF76152.1 DEAD/DEAH box helicase [Babesia microti strain RI]|eukprot:XP_012650560.1 DEAD/DEAH box helicase [Babesia microti strain RI]
MEEIDPLDAFMQSLNDTIGSYKNEDKSGVKRGIDELDEEYDIADFCEYMNTKEYLDRLNPGNEDTKESNSSKPFPLLLSAESSEPPFYNFTYTHISEIESMSLDELTRLKEKLRICTTGSRVPTPITKFDHISHCMPDKLMDNIKKMGFITPTPIQCQAIPSILMKRDTIIFGETGSGKTLSFLLPMTSLLSEHLKHDKDVNKFDLNCLVITPTRELCMQHYNTFKKLSKDIGITTVALMGDVDKAFLIKTLSKGCHVIISSMGRLADFVHSKVIDLSHIKLLVIDEADKLFTPINIKQTESLIGGTPTNKITVFVSATKTDKILDSMRKLAKSPIVISVGNPEAGYPIDKVDVNFIITQTLANKKLWLFDILPMLEDKGQVIIFCNTKSQVEELAEILNDPAIRQTNKVAIFARGIHGQMSANDRDNVVEKFKKLLFPTLVTTSVFSRGIDIASIKVVINFDAPKHFHEYCHRIGRCSRGESNGIAYTLIDPKRDLKMVIRIVEHLQMFGREVPNDLLKIVRGFK